MRQQFEQKEREVFNERSTFTIVNSPVVKATFEREKKKRRKDRKRETGGKWRKCQS